jgi:hypothetical protein
MQMVFNRVTQILGEKIHKYAYSLSSYAFFRTHLSLKENTYPIRDIKFYMIYTYTIQYVFIILPL